MVEISNWFLSFIARAVSCLFGMVSPDGYSLGSMLVGITITGAVVMATIGAVNVFGHNHTITKMDKPRGGYGKGGYKK